jgi:MoaA/NifB/PqqE/SkfB family radical SAM enzyme/polysaccharide pyruvyl transferase WcaK-like protein
VIKKIIKFILKCLFTILEDIKRHTWYQFFPRLPEGINMNANDICNSKCVMCNIWQQKQEYEFSPEELETALKDPLFRKVQFVGITGGEPTLRADLIGLYQSCINALPALTNLSIITNGIKEKDALAKIISINNLCIENNIAFSAMVSLDGVGSVHDKHRGREGNFITSIWLIEEIKKLGIPVSFGCTITKTNVWDIQELEEYVTKNNIPGRFRVGEFIKRLYHDDTNKDEIRNFNDEELFHLQNFFHKYSVDYVLPEATRRNYLSIFNILTGKNRSMSCPHQDRAVQMDSKGVLHYCAPKSESIGSAIKESGLKLWHDNLKERRRIMKEHCSSCIHDYYGPITFKEIVTNITYLFWARFWEEYAFHKAKVILLFPIVTIAYWISKLNFGKKKQIMISGWYGTETTGDKAILAGIISRYKERYPYAEFIIASMFPFVTVKTLKELQIEAKIVNTKSWEYLKGIIQADEVAFGGGPLMDLEALSLSYYAFKLINLKGGNSTIFGCGLGPLLQDKYISIVSKMINLSKDVFVRDSKSVGWVKQHTNKGETVINTGDPAGFYVSSIKDKFESIIQEDKIACFLRSWTPEYAGHLTKQEYEDTTYRFESSIAKMLIKYLEKYNYKMVLYPMHTFHLGGDDREFYRYFVDRYLSDFADRVEIYQYNSNVNLIIESMKSSKINICMRFHSVLMAEELDTNFVAIDYTSGGKIKALLTDKNKQDRLISIQEIIDDNYELL